MESRRAEASGRSATTRWLIAAGVVVTALAVWFLTRPARQRAKARHDVEVLALALDGYAREQGEYPHGECAQICRLLLGETIGSQNPRKLDYVEASAYEINASGEFVDPWGAAYRISFSPILRVYSCGPNRVDEQGVGDDIATGN